MMNAKKGVHLMNVSKIIVLSFIASGVLLANETTTLAEITTISSATKTEKNIDGVSASVVVIDEREIAKMGAGSLKDIINATPGLHVQYGTFPSASSVSKGSLVLRGMGSKGTLLLIDGRRVGGEVANPYDLDRIPASQIERIEIVKGPMSTLYGADATGGIINIITKKPKDEPSIDLGVRYGQNSEGDDQNKNGNLGVRGKADKLGYSFYVNKTETTPYTQYENADVYTKQGAAKVKPSVHANPAVHALSDSYTHEAVTYREESNVLTYGGRLSYDVSENVVAGIEFNRFSEEREGSYIGYFHPTNYGSVPAYNVPINSKDDNERLDIGADVKIKASDDLSLTLRAYNSSYEKRNTVTAKYWADMGYTSQGASAQNGMDANVDVSTYEALVNYLLNENHLLTLGMERRFEKREGTVFALSSGMSEKKVDYSALYLQDEWQATQDLSLVFGGRFDEISNADDKPTFKIGGVNRFNESLHVRANFAQGYRTPDIRELYIFKNTAAGMQRGAAVVDASVGKLTAYDLSPEFSNSYEVGASGKIGSGKYDVALFYNDIEDMISEVNKGSYYTFKNIPKAKTYGSEVSWMQPVFDKTDLKLSWMELRTKNKESGKELEFNPERTVGAKFTYNHTKDFSNALGAHYIGEQFYRKTLGRGTPTESIVDATADGYITLNWGINYAVNKTTTVYGGINNLTDETIEDVLGSSSGRYFFMGVKVNL